MIDGSWKKMTIGIGKEANQVLFEVTHNILDSHVVKRGAHCGTNVKFKSRWKVLNNQDQILWILLCPKFFSKFQALKKDLKELLKEFEMDKIESFMTFWHHYSSHNFNFLR